MRVAGDAPPRVGVRDPVGELVQVRLPEDDGPGRPELGDRGGIARRHPVPQDPGARGGSQAPGREQVLDRNRYPQQRAGLTPRQPPFGPACLAPGPFLRDRDKGAQALRLGDPPEVRVYQFDGGDLPPPQRPRDPDEGSGGQRFNRRHPAPQPPGPFAALRPAPGSASMPAAGRPHPRRSAEARRPARRRPAVPSPSPPKYAIRDGRPVNGSITTCECKIV